jgi:branched-chain amino acid transport system substrate-binding protein
MSELQALMVTPLSGPLARFGVAAATGLRLWAEGAAKLPPPFRRVRLEIRDAHPDAALAMRQGLASQPHLVFGPYGSSPTRRALTAAERLVWNHGGASTSIRWPTFPLVVNVLAPASTYFRGALEAVRSRDPDARRVAILHAATGFGSDVARGARQTARELGFEVTVKGFQGGEAGPAAATLPAAEVLLVAASFEDELESARLLLRRSWRAAGFVGAGVDEVLAPLGDAREGLLGPAQWIATATAEPDEGPDVIWFQTRYRSAVGGDPPYPAAQAFAAGLLAARSWRECRENDRAAPVEPGGALALHPWSPSDEAQLAAARRLACRTLYGDFRLDPVTGLQMGHRVVTVQWQDGRRRAIWPPERAEADLVYPRAGAELPREV